MKNFGYLVSVFMNLKFPAWGGEEKKDIRIRLRGNIFRFLFALLGVILFGYALIKVYEVPVYYTKIDMVTNNCSIDQFVGLNIKICRNYDRNYKSTIIPDSVWGINHNDPSGIYIYGVFNNKFISHNDDIKKTNKILDRAKKIQIKDKDSLIFNSHMAYVSVQTSNRQSFLPYIRNNSLHIDSFSNCILTTKFLDSIFTVRYTTCLEDSYKIRKLLNINEIESTDNGFIHHDYTFSSPKDTKFLITIGFTNYVFKKPSVFFSAEDVSKLVETIEIGHSKREKTSNFGASWNTETLIIDYVGQAVFPEHISPEPDEITLSSIIYRNRSKIHKIGREGLKYHVSFPDMENVQEARIFILSGLLTGIGALFIRYLWRIVCDIYLLVIDKIKQNRKVKYGVLFTIIVILILISFLIYYSLLESNVNPFELKNNLMEEV